MSNNLAQKLTEKKVIKKIDINAIVDKARSAYGKKEGGLAKQISNGTSILRPEKDNDFILWQDGDLWKSLTGLKGIPFGINCEISGKSDSGKSTFASIFMKFAQDQGHVVILWDAENKFSKIRFTDQIGGNAEELLVINTKSIIEGVEAITNVIHAIKEVNPKVKMLLVWDSVGSSLNSSEGSEEFSHSKQPGVSAKEVSFAIKQFNKLGHKYKDRETGEESLAVLAINQTYSTIGVGPSVQVEKGGNTLYYLSSLILQLSRKKDLTRVKEGKKYKYGIISRVRVKKNHLLEGTDCLAELDICVSSKGITLTDEVKKDKDVTGWDDPEEMESDE
jgi:RecA/RadA recombinase